MSTEEKRPRVNNSPIAQRIRLDFAPNQHCHASRGDGECFWSECPQLRNGGIDYQSYCCPLEFDYEDD